MNALRAYLYEFGHIAPLGVHQVKRLAEIVDAEDGRLPKTVRLCCREILAQIVQLGERLRCLDSEIARLPRQSRLWPPPDRHVKKCPQHLPASPSSSAFFY
ncbi:MAG: hypothetical protein Q7J44_21085 [Pseudotabrizicola sp.]|uniref:hypothetical protein n=1 Tax=Pseudotabrizicola sp. TaxID=2939647 RepID=UPI002722D67C|nr:hypothetical protein [Pseudotabrizicola sp.]MDO9641034.1 hypothetical protein [Pseudotabrizicola sp.]